MCPEAPAAAVPVTSPAAVRHWFVYYRVDPQHLAAALTSARRLQAKLRALHPALQTTIMQRLDDRDVGYATLMETYRFDPRGQVATAEQVRHDIESAGRQLNGVAGLQQRHLEDFVTCA